MRTAWPTRPTECGAGWTRDQRLDIMKDSRIGAYGASMLILALLAKYAALTSMDAARLDVSLVTAQMLGRWAFLPMGYFHPNAREGLASEFMKGLTAKALLFGTGLTGDYFGATFQFVEIATYDAFLT